MKLAIMLPNWVGDACMATPTIRALRNGLPQLTELCLVGRPAPIMVLDGLLGVDSTIVYKPRSDKLGLHSRRSLARELRCRKFDSILLLTNSLSTAMIAWWARIPRRMGYARDARSWLLTDRLPVRTSEFDANSSPCIDTYLRLAQAMGCETDDRRMELACTAVDRAAADALWKSVGFSGDLPTVLLNTGAATYETKRWPADHAAHAARVFAEQHQLQVLVHCGPGERESANEIESLVGHPRVRSMGHTHDLPLGLSKGAIERSSIVVSTDSGPRHMAVALNKPVVSLFGSITASLTTTYNTPERIIQLGLSCQPCGKQTCPLGHTACMNALDSGRVIAATLESLRRNAVPRSAA
jgi:heptosyltransferase-2